MSRKYPRMNKECPECEGQGEFGSTEDPRSPQECTACHGSGYAEESPGDYQDAMDHARDSAQDR